MAGFREFVTGEVLTAANVDDFLMKQSVMKFADAAARDSALGTAVGGGNALREGMVAYLDDTNDVLKYDGSAWIGLGAPDGFDDIEIITATDASWSIPSLAHPVVRVTVIGGGGGGAGSLGNDGSAGGASSVAASGLSTVTAAGGKGGRAPHGAVYSGPAVDSGWVSGNGGYGGSSGNRTSGFLPVVGQDGKGGAVAVAYLDTTGLTTLNVTIGAGGAGGAAGSGSAGSAGGSGVVLVDYKAA